MVILGMKGLGDNIYQRCFIPPGEHYLETPWPQLYRDMPDLKLIECHTSLRTQAKNVAACHGHVEYHRPYGHARRVIYADKGIYHGMVETLGPLQRTMSLPDFGPPPVDGDYVLYRPATVRSEWRADSRNPRHDYLVEAVEAARAQGLKVVSVADLQPGAEWLVSEKQPQADVKAHHGEFNVEQLLALVAGAKAAVGGVGWLLPAVMAYNTPSWIIFGGQGGYNAPELLTHPEFGPNRVAAAVPDNFCRCKGKTHGCDKTITGHGDAVRRWASALAT